MMPLSDYLDRVLTEEWRWGALDCCFFAGNWIRAATGLDPLGPYRGTYDDARGAARLIAARGGLLRMVDVEMARCGFSRTERPEHGDIAILPVSGDGPARASVVIMNGPWWLGCSLDGISGVRAEPEAAWRVLGLHGAMRA